jgi:nucleotide-binding universal stress UspA family protein
MAYQRIVVGVDGSLASRRAVQWAMREAARRGAFLLVVTAWPGRAGGRAPATLMAQRIATTQMQRRLVEEARHRVATPVRVGTEIILADPVTALCHASRVADLLVIGGVRRRRTADGKTLAAGCTERAACPVAVISTAGGVRPVAVAAVAVGGRGGPGRPDHRHRVLLTAARQGRHS